MGDAEVGDDVVDDVGAGSATPGDEAQVAPSTWRLGRMRRMRRMRRSRAGAARLRPVREPVDQGVGVGEGPGAQADHDEHQCARAEHAAGSSGLVAGQVEDDPGRALGEGVERRRAPRARAPPAATPPRAESTWHPPSPGNEGTRRSGGTRPRTSRRSSHRRPGRCSTPAVTSSPPRSQVEVDDDGRRPGGGEPAADREGQRAGAEAAGGADDGDEGWAGGHVTRVPPAGRSATTRRRDLWTNASPGSDLWTTAPVAGPLAGLGSTHQTDPRCGHGTAPVGGTTGAVGEPSSGGEKPVRRSLNPEGERVSPSCLMTGSPRKPSILTCRKRPQHPLRTTESVGFGPEI